MIDNWYNPNKSKLLGNRAKYYQALGIFYEETAS